MTLAVKFWKRTCIGPLAVVIFVIVGPVDVASAFPGLEANNYPGPALVTYAPPTNVVVFPSDGEQEIVGTDVALQAGESRRLLGQVRAVLSDPSFRAIDDEVGVRCLDATRAPSPPAAWSSSNLLPGNGETLTASLLFTAPSAGVYHCQLVALEDAEGQAMTVQSGDSWLKISAAAETGAQSWSNPPCDSVGDSLGSSRCLYLGPGQPDQATDLLDESGVPWTAADNATTAEATANVELTTCGSPWSCGGRKYDGWKYDAPGTTVTSYLEVTQLTAAGDVCSTTKAEPRIDFVKVGPHHYNIPYNLPTITILNTCGSRNFQLHVHMAWGSGNTVKIDGARPDDDGGEVQTEGFIVNSNYVASTALPATDGGWRTPSSR